MDFSSFRLLIIIKRLIIKHKILSFFILCFVIFSFKNCFCIEYLQDSYPNMDYSNYVEYDSNEGVYKVKTAGNKKSYCTDYMILYGTQYGRFNIIFFPEGLYFNNSYGKGNPQFPENTWNTNSPYNVPSDSYNYINLEYNSDGSFRNFTNYSRQSGFGGWWEYILYSTCTINDQNNSTIILEPSQEVDPSFLNTSQEFASLDFDLLLINPGTYDDTLIFRLYDTTEARRLIDIYFIDGEYDDYIEREDLGNPFSNLIYKIPLEILKPFSYVKDHTYRWQLVYGESSNQQYVNVDVTATVSEEVNGVTNADIQNSINETNNKLDNINDTLTDDSISSVSSNDLPSISVEDPTEEGIGTIFDNIYDAFCEGNAQNIIFPIPYTNKSITLDPYYIQNMLTQHNATWVLTFIQAFWGYLFGRFIIKDMASKIRKIKSGNIEGLQDTNIKEEML